MVTLFLIALIVLCCFSVTVRVICFHPFKACYYAVVDLYDYIIHKKWRNADYGFIIGIIGLFGKGKTLTAVHKVIKAYNKHNDKMVWCPRRKKWVTQKVRIISNVELQGVPYERFISLMQLVQIAESITEYDDEHDTLTITLVLGDEFSVQLNSRAFKTNIDPLFLNTILTCRHFHMGLYYTAQRFGHVDALLRQVTQTVVNCIKVWRVEVQEDFDAWELENATSPTMITPKRRYGWFISNKDYNSYDTYATVGNLSKSCKEGDMLTQEEILQLQVGATTDSGQIMNPSRKYRRHRKKMA
ncbi:MAG: hypothetical protein IJ326_05415 [Lachnospiraceae bacterium]|nr:hypothetical protein [Lachnospiraceae bacterium]